LRTVKTTAAALDHKAFLHTLISPGETKLKLQAESNAPARLNRKL
jgi:hypothetical protein